MEPGQRSVMGTDPAGVGGRGGLRPHAGRPLPSYRAISPLAFRQEAERLHVCAVGSRATAGIARDFFATVEAICDRRNPSFPADLYSHLTPPVWPQMSAVKWLVVRCLMYLFRRPNHPFTPTIRA